LRLTFEQAEVGVALGFDGQRFGFGGKRFVDPDAANFHTAAVGHVADGRRFELALPFETIGVHRQVDAQLLDLVLPGGVALPALPLPCACGCHCCPQQCGPLAEPGIQSRHIPTKDGQAVRSRVLRA